MDTLVAIISDVKVFLIFLIFTLVVSHEPIHLGLLRLFLRITPACIYWRVLACLFERHNVHTRALRRRALLPRFTFCTRRCAA